MFPVRDDNPTFLAPVTTAGIIALNAAVWVFVQGLGAEPRLSASICQLGLIPGELLDIIPPGSRIALGHGLYCPVTGELAWTNVLTSMFLHGGWFHLIGNMWFLWIFGNNVEDAMGHTRFLVFYILCGLAAAGLQVAFNPASPVPMVGASGAIGGVMGAYIVLYPRVHVHMLLFLGFFVTTFAVPAVVMLGYWIVVQLLGGFGSIGATGGGVAFWAHVGGFVTGAVLVTVFKNRRLLDRHPYHGWRQAPSPTRNWHRIDRR